MFLTAGGDYTAIASETVTFAPGETCVSVVVNVTDDEVHEKNETFVGSLKINNSTLDNVLIVDPSMAAGTIVDDDDLSKSNAISLVKSNKGICFLFVFFGFQCMCGRHVAIMLEHNRYE